MDVRAKEAIEKGVRKLTGLQQSDGSWRGLYDGPNFLLPMYVVAQRLAGRPIPRKRAEGLLRQIEHWQNPDGSIGLCLQDSGSMFTTALNYVAARMLGAEPERPSLERMRGWIHSNGTPLGAASWGKFFLALCNLYPYDGLTPLMPELWILPYAVPVHPGRLWCHCRQVYLPMAWLYGRRVCMPEDELIRALRRELYGRDYGELDFSAHRFNTSPCDGRFPPSRLLVAADGILRAAERLSPGRLRERALRRVLDCIDYEDRTTGFIDIGPVNGVLNSIVQHVARPGSDQARRAFDALDEYLYEEDGRIGMNGYNSTALWDTAFSVQAILAAGLGGRYRECLRAAHRYIRENQVLEDPPEHERWFRDPARGGWPFSDRRHGWPISDCTAEGFKASVYLSPYVENPLPEHRLRWAVELILGWQNADGGWATYEKRRGGGWLELLNPSDVFGDIMVDYSYPECTSACLQALALARGRFGRAIDRRIDRAVRRGVRYLLDKQFDHGGWEGSWAVCFSYGTWFAVSGLLASGIPPTSEPVRRACGYLVGKQNPDGGFGEHHESCMAKRWLRAESTPTQTAWVLMTLCRSGLAGTTAAHRAADYLVRTQQPDGDWPREAVLGVFNKSTLIRYDNYRRYFTVRALAEYAQCRDGWNVPAV